MIKAWIFIGLLVGGWSFLEFLSETTIENDQSSWGYMKIGLLGVLFIIIDVLIWPLYLLARFMEWFWRFRRRL